MWPCTKHKRRKKCSPSYVLPLKQLQLTTSVFFFLFLFLFLTITCFLARVQSQKKKDNVTRVIVKVLILNGCSRTIAWCCWRSKNVLRNIFRTMCLQTSCWLDWSLVSLSSEFKRKNKIVANETQTWLDFLKKLVLCVS